jgi:hypothetical protein
MKLTLDPDSTRKAYEVALKNLESELIRQSILVGEDIDKLNPDTYEPDYTSEHYELHKPAYDLFMSILRRWRMVNDKLKDL